MFFNSSPIVLSGIRAGNRRMRHKLISFLRKYRDCQQGSVAIGFGVFGVVLITSGGMAMDYVMGSQHRSNLQSAADSAAVATAHEIPLATSTPSQIEALAVSYAMANFGSDNTVTVTATMLDKVGVRVNIEKRWEPVFSHLVFDSVTPIVVTATAEIYGGGAICMIGLATSKKDAIHLKKNARLDASGCGVYANSSDRQSIKLDDNSEILAGLTCSVGGIDGLSKASIEPKPETDCPPIQDPLANRQPPPVGLCDHKKLEIRDETRTLSPGTYCDGLKIKGKAIVTLLPGIYVIKGGKLEVTDDASIEGEAVGFYLAGNKAKLTFKKRTTISLSAPTDGVMAGLLIFEDRGASKIEKHEITSDNARLLLGTIYLPNGTLKIDAEGPVADKSAYTAIIARAIELDEGPTLYLNSDYESTAVPLPDGLLGGRTRLVN